MKTDLFRDDPVLQSRAKSLIFALHDVYTHLPAKYMKKEQKAMQDSFETFLKITTSTQGQYDVSIADVWVNEQEGQS